MQKSDKFKPSLLRKYNVNDLINFHRFANAKGNKRKKMFQLVKEYNVLFPEISAERQLANLFDGLGMKHKLKPCVHEWKQLPDEYHNSYTHRCIKCGALDKP